MMQHNHHLAAMSSRECSRMAPLLPLLAEHLLSERDAGQLQEHLVGCAYCRSELASYDQLDGALRQRYGAAHRVPSYAGEIMRTIRQREEAVTIMPRRSFARVGRIYGGSLIGAIAAILVVVLLTQHFSVHRSSPLATPFMATIPVLTPSQLVRPPQVQLESISMVSSSDGWAGGYLLEVPMGQSTALVLHYNGTTWKQVPFPSSNSSDIIGLSMGSAADGWATDSNQLFHYTGGRWTAGPIVADLLTSPTNAPPYALNSITMLSATEGWAVGDSFQGQQNTPTGQSVTEGLVLHYVHGVWSLATGLPDASDLFYYNLFNITMLSAGEGWAVGESSSPQDGRRAFALHYHQGIWMRYVIPVSAQLNVVVPVSDHEAWAFGKGEGGKGVILHFFNGQWTQDAYTTTNTIFSAAKTSQTDIWCDNGGGSFLHYDGASWQPVAFHTSVDIRKMAFVGSGEGWAVGMSDLGAGVTPVLHYANGQWSDYPLKNFNVGTP